MRLHCPLKSCEHTQGQLPAVTLTPGEPSPLCSMSPRPHPAQARACLQPHLRSPGVMICLLLEEGKEPGGETKPLKCFSDERLLQDKREAGLRPCHRCYSVCWKSIPLFHVYITPGNRSAVLTYRETFWVPPGAPSRVSTDAQEALQALADPPRWCQLLVQTV